MKLSDPYDRAQALEFIAEAALFGNLGLFIGSGFSKAVMNERHKVALSWAELLERAAAELPIDYEKLPLKGLSYPEVASRIVEMHAASRGIDHRRAQSDLKEKIAKLTSWYPDKERRKLFSRYLRLIKPSWIITTNYELIIESLLTGRSITIGPRDEFIRPRALIPVFHLHGIRTEPESIIITQEDYVTLFRPNEYRQIKLALTIKESTTLIIGYGLGDVNVLTAMDWSENVFGDSNSAYPRDVIQILRTEKPKAAPYRDSSGILIIETDQLEKFFDELVPVVIANRKALKKKKQALKDLANELNQPKSQYVERFIDDGDFRVKVLDLLSKSENYFISGFMEFLFACIDTTWDRAAPDGAFFAYNENLRIVLDVFERFSVKNMPPALFESLASDLERVGYYVGDDRGQSFEANRTWNKRRRRLPAETVEELRNYAVQKDCVYIPRLLDTDGW